MTIHIKRTRQEYSTMYFITILNGDTNVVVTSTDLTQFY